MSVKEKIEQLNLEQRRQLAHAFDHGFSQFIEFGSKEFVGVHIDFEKIKNLQSKEQAGVWSYGTIS